MGNIAGVQQSSSCTGVDKHGVQALPLLKRLSWSMLSGFRNSKFCFFSKSVAKVLVYRRRAISSIATYVGSECIDTQTLARRQINSTQHSPSCNGADESYRSYCPCSAFHSATCLRDLARKMQMYSNANAKYTLNIPTQATDWKRIA